MPSQPKLTEPIVSFARRRARIGANTKEIADDFGIDANDLADAIQGRTFTYLQDPPPATTLTVTGASRYATPNSPTRLVARDMRINGPRLKAVREKHLVISQTTFAQRINRACKTVGYEDTHCTKRLVQKWENGEHALPAPHYQHAIMLVTGESIRDLCAPTAQADITEAQQRLALIIATAQEQHHELMAALKALHDYLNAVPVPIPEAHCDPAEDAKDTGTRKPRDPYTRMRADVKALLSEEIPAGPVAGRFGISDGVVKMLRQTPGLESTRFVDEAKAQRIRTAYQAKVTWHEICATEGVSLATIQRVISDLPRRRRPTPPLSSETVTELYRLLDTGLSNAAIARTLHIHPTTVTTYRSAREQT